MKQRQVNIRLSEDDHRALRYWAYERGLSASDFARQALVELIERLVREREATRNQPALPL